MSGMYLPDWTTLVKEVDPRVIGRFLHDHRTAKERSPKDISDCLSHTGWGQISEHRILDWEKGARISPNMVNHVLSCYGLTNNDYEVVYRAMLWLTTHDEPRHLFSSMVETLGFAKGQTRLDVENQIQDIHKTINALQATLDQVARDANDRINNLLPKLNDYSSRITTINDLYNCIEGRLSSFGEDLKQKASTQSVDKLSETVRALRENVRILTDTRGLDVAQSTLGQGRQQTKWARGNVYVAVGVGIITVMVAILTIAAYDWFGWFSWVKEGLRF